MGKHTFRAILHPGFQYPEIPPTFLEKVQWAKAEETVELFRLARLVTGEVLALSIIEKTVAILHGANLLLSPHSHKEREHSHAIELSETQQIQEGR